MIRTTTHLAEDLRREHAFVRRAVEEIADELERLRADPEPVRHGAKLLGMLAMFRLHLLRHFELEEQGGLLADREQWNPGVRRTIRGLLKEHRSMEARLEAVIEGLEDVACGQEVLSLVFADELEGFLTELRAHERTEDGLAQELAYRDVGSGD